ncbi:MAG: hypothetical protein KGJ07_02120 [Patescibacteria group bacterium]|nr:hypothetical protein [Patescibacteria group bacterium]
MTNTALDELPWENIKEISEKGLFEQVFNKIPKDRFQFAAKAENYEILVQSALKSLQKTNPEATEEQARLLADLMQNFAHKVVEEER